MDYNISTELQQYVDSNEKLVWTGRPRTGIVFRSADIFLIPFSLFFCGFAIFWFTTALTSGAPFIFAMFGIPFVVIGIIMVFGRFIIDAKQRENTYYGLTNDRIIIKSGIYTKSIKSLNIKTLSDIQYVEKNDGSGTINFGQKNPIMISSNGMNWWPGVNETPSLDLIQDVRKVYNKIVEIQKSK
jgi:hypothetical protein